MNKFLSMLFTVVFLLSCLCFVGTAENTTEPPIEHTTEPTGYVQLTTDVAEDTTAAATVHTVTTTTTRKTTAALLPTKAPLVVSDATDYSEEGYTGSLTKTTRATVATTTTTKAVKKINDFGETYRPLKIVALIFMILSAAALVIVNVRYRQLHPKAKKRRTAKKPAAKRKSK